MENYCFHGRARWRQCEVQLAALVFLRAGEPAARGQCRLAITREVIYK